MNNNINVIDNKIQELYDQINIVIKADKINKSDFMDIIGKYNSIIQILRKHSKKVDDDIENMIMNFKLMDNFMAEIKKEKEKNRLIIIS